jgi:serpin B
MRSAIRGRMDYLASLSSQLHRLVPGCLAVAIAAGGCGSGPDASAGDDALVRSERAQVEPVIADAELAEQVWANTKLALDLFHRLRAQAPDDNIFMSPYSISIALAMTHAGARGDTADEIREALRFVLDGDGHHAAFNALDRALASRPGEVDDEDALRLSVANALWAQDEYPVQEPFLDVLAEHYDTGMRLLDFIAAPEASRAIINDWVAARTEEKIPELLPQGAISQATRFVLTNAIYLKADWLHPFEAHETRDAPFYRLDGSEVRVEQMNQIARLPYAAGEDYQVAVMPYVGESLSMAFLVPDEGRFEAVETGLDADALADALAKLEVAEVALGLPRFEFSADFDLVPHFKALGMRAAFDADLSDFSGIHGGADPRLHITGIFHEAFVAVDEEGTEAAAATGVVGGTDSAPSYDVSLHIDRPFLFAILDEPTGTVLFLGRVLDPTAD